MNKFPDSLNPKNKANFSLEYSQRILVKLREEVYLHILSHKDTDYYDLDKFRVLNHPLSVGALNKMTEQIMIELNKIGWKTRTAYGKTGLFIYDGEKPVNCYEDNF